MFEVTPASAMILKVGFDPTLPGVDRGYLVVQFANFDAWGYSDVEYFDVLMLMNAPSVGTAFNTLIKGKYKGTLLLKQDTHVVKQSDMAKPKVKEEDNVPMFEMMDAPRKRKP